MLTDRLIPILALCLIAGAAPVWPEDRPAELSEEVRQVIREQVKSSESRGSLQIAGRTLHARRSVAMFYHRRGFWSAWGSRDALENQIPELLEELAAARQEGLDPEDYHQGRLQELFARRQSGELASARGLADFDLLLTDAYLLFASHRLSGVVNPETYDPEWFSNRREADIADGLQTALLQSRVQASLQALKPKNADYEALEAALEKYRDIGEQGGWETVVPGPTLEKGVEDGRVKALRQRLKTTGDLSGDLLKLDKEHFGDDLESAVKNFQARHGLETDGKVGPKTLEALNRPVQDRIEQIRVNLERWRWLPENLGDPHVRVNAADFSLQVIEGGGPVMSMKVIVGMPYRRTPVFSSRITHMVVNPYWYVTKNIAVKDKLPLIKKDPGYLERNGFTVLSGQGANASVVDPDSVQWGALSEDNFPYLLRQEPGPGNALGRVKFMFPNRYNVYLHDTPSQELFERTQRTFSSGCIRLEKPLDLAQYLLGRDSATANTDIRKLIESGEQKTVRLSQTVAVHLQYWTVWVDGKGLVQFRQDIYNRDTSVIAALRQKPVP